MRKICIFWTPKKKLYQHTVFISYRENYNLFVSKKVEIYFQSIAFEYVGVELYFDVK